MIRRPIGTLTRGTTNPNRLRRVDTWLTSTLSGLLRQADDPLVVDLGYGASPVTTVELYERLRRIRPDVRVVGVEIDPVRVSGAQSYAAPPGLEFRRGGFEVGGLRPVLIRALNVLRQYDESQVAGAWATMTAALTPGGVLVEGTCDELGRLGTWLAIPATPAAATPTGTQPTTLTLAAKLTTLPRPAIFAQRLPKALIHHNVSGEPIHSFLTALDTAWLTAAGYREFGAVDRFSRAVAATRDLGWPVLPQPRRWRRGELTLAWDAVAPPPSGPAASS